MNAKIKIGAVIIAILIAYLFIQIPADTENKSDARSTQLQKIAQTSTGTVGQVGKDAIGINPTTFLSSWNFNNLAKQQRSKFYKETPLTDGTLLREYWLDIQNKEIEVAPGLFYPAWTYNGQVPGPTIRATEGDTVRIHFSNSGDTPHSIHSHGFHTSDMDGVMTEKQGLIMPGESFTYEFKADPFGTHVYHCHGVPVSEHIARGLYGAYIVDPKIDSRSKPDKELVMVMNGFDVNFDGENEIYAVNSIAFEYARNPIQVKQGELVRIHLSNMLEFDMINSFHVHANFFNEYPTGTKLKPDFFTDTTVMGQGERSILDIRFKFPGKYMFHAHKTEFAELGWMGFFEVSE